MPRGRLCFAVFVLVEGIFIAMGCGHGDEESYASRATAADAPEEVTLDLGGNVGIEFVRIPAGSFLMGTPESAREGPGETQHEVTITRPFYMGRYEVARAQYERVMGKNPSIVHPGSKMPAEEVSWNDAVEFCRKASSMVKAKVRLPTEAEWEYACRAGSNTRFCFGDDDAALGDYAWYTGNSNVHTPGERFPDLPEPRPVGRKKPNAFGLYDMHGNVREWCSDWFKPYDANPRTDPKGPPYGQTHIIRGGQYGNSAAFCRSAARYWERARHRSLGLGFRIVME